MASWKPAAFESIGLGLGLSAALVVSWHIQPGTPAITVYFVLVTVQLFLYNILRTRCVTPRPPGYPTGNAEELETLAFIQNDSQDGADLRFEFTKLEGPRHCSVSGLGLPVDRPMVHL